MIVPDVNLLIYAADRDSGWHREASAWWEKSLNGSERIGLTWVTILGFIRVATNSRVVRTAVSPARAIETVRTWLSVPAVRIVEPGERHAEILFELLERLGTAGNLTTDAHLAAFAIEFHARIATNDADFLRFPGVRWFNPLATSS